MTGFAFADDAWRRPSGLVARLDRGEPQGGPEPYGREALGARDAGAQRLAARLDRRGRRRPRRDGLRGRLLDLLA